jgi:hypothetical protein
MANNHTCPTCAAAVAEAAKREAALRLAANTLIQRLAKINLGESEERAWASAMQYGSEVVALQDVMEDLSPAVAALERRLASLELRAKLLPCGHPGACAVFHSGGGRTYCRWCEEKAELNAAITQLYDDLARAEALAELVPLLLLPEHAQILVDLQGHSYLAEWHLEPRVRTYVICGEKPDMYKLQDWGLVEELPDLGQRFRLTELGRALAASIEEARREQEDGN